MIEGTTSEGGSQDNLARRGLALVASLLVVLWTAWLTIAPPADARPAASAGGPPGLPTTTADSTTTTTRSTTTVKPTTTRAPSTTAPPQTTESTSPPTSDDPPVTEDTEPEEEEPEDTGTTRDAELLGLSPISTSENLLVAGNGTPGSESAQAPAEEEKTKDGGSSDEDRVIWMIIAGLGAVALLVALLTWRYWLLTRPGIDLSDDDPDDGGGGYYGGGPPAPAPDPYGAAPRMADVNPMTTGMPPAPAATGWQEPASPQRPPQRRGPDRGPAPEPRRTRQPRRAEADPFPSQPAPPPSAPPQRGRGGRGRRGADPFWDDVGDQAPRRQPPDQGRRRPDPGDPGERDPWGRGR